MINHFLKDCSALTEKLLLKALFEKKLTEEENNIAKELGFIANILTAIYFFRKGKTLEEALKEAPLGSELAIKTIWRRLETTTEEERTDIAIEAIQKHSELVEELNK